jgi:hypothetical protein
MPLTDVYVQVYGQLGDFFQKISEGQAPSQFTHQYLKDLGFRSTNHRRFIPLLKALGFLSADGIPTPRYHEYRNKARSAHVMAEALREAYGDVFTIKARPSDVDKQMIEGKFKSSHNVSDHVAKLMGSTFYSLMTLADLDELSLSKPEKPVKEKEKKENPKDQGPEQKFNAPPGLHYNIQVHLPATKDIEVFNESVLTLQETYLRDLSSLAASFEV